MSEHEQFSMDSDGLKRTVRSIHRFDEVLVVVWAARVEDLTGDTWGLEEDAKPEDWYLVHAINLKTGERCEQFNPVTLRRWNIARRVARYIS